MLAAGFAGPLSDRAKDYVSSILAASARLGQLVDEVLDLTRSAAGHLDLEHVAIDLGDVCRDVAEQLEGEAKARGLELLVAVEPSTGVVAGDVRRLRQTIEHVLRNAVHYTQEGGRVFLQASGDDEQATVIVSDNGPGIDPDERERIFDPFHRATVKGDRREGSIGLGLPLTRHYVEAHGGSVWLESEPGRGTTVSIRLPRAAS